jgi:hypothetical protein
MRHLTEAEFARIADGSLDSGDVSALDLAAHVSSCTACRAEVDAQLAARRVLLTRPIAPVRDLSAAVRATLEAERPWIERLNWRRLSLRVAPVAAALSLVAFLVVSSADQSGLADSAATDHTVASALWSGEVSDDQLLTLFLSAHPDDALSTYVATSDQTDKTQKDK